MVRRLVDTKISRYDVNRRIPRDDTCPLYPDNFNCTFVEISSSVSDSIGGNAIIAIGDNKIRKKISFIISHTFTTLIHPTSIIDKYVVIENGSVILHNAIIQRDSNIGKHCIINTGACIDHDCNIEDFVHIAPNCSLAGGINIGEGTLIGIGSSIVQNIEVGRWTKVGAGSVLVHNQPSFCVSLGAPAKPIKFNNV